MYLDELKTFKRKLEDKRGEIKGHSVIDTVYVPLNIQEIEYIIKTLNSVDRVR